METVQDRMDAGDILIIDGGMGTELERRGAPMDAQSWAGSALKDHPDMIRAIHRDFIDAGADILIANTYAAAPHVLCHAGFSETEALALNRLPANSVREAVAEAAPDRRIWIAGSLSSSLPASTPAPGRRWTRLDGAMHCRPRPSSRPAVIS